MGHFRHTALKHKEKWYATAAEQSSGYYIIPGPVHVPYLVFQVEVCSLHVLLVHLKVFYLCKIINNDPLAGGDDDLNLHFFCKLGERGDIRKMPVSIETVGTDHDNVTNQPAHDVFEEQPHFFPLVRAFCS